MRRKGLWERHSVGRQVLVVLVVLIATGHRLTDQYHFLTEERWLHVRLGLFLTALIGAVVVLINTLGDLVVQRSSVKGEGRRTDIRKAVTSALITISEESQVPIKDLGANVFLVSRSKVRKKRLERIERVRLSETPLPSNVAWFEGKGLIGRCWNNERVEHVSWSKIARRWSGKDISEERWGSIPDADKQGFTKAEFVSMVGKYAEILAVPLQDANDKFMGCLAIDRIWRSGQPDLSVLNSSQVEGVATEAAAILRSVLAGV